MGEIIYININMHTISRDNTIVNTNSYGMYYVLSFYEPVVRGSRFN